MREHNKLRRLAGICELIKFGSAPVSKARLQIELRRMTGVYTCVSQIEKDIYKLRNEYDAPIKYVGIGSVGYVMTGSYVFWANYLMNVKAELNLPYDLVCIIEKNLD